MQQHGIADPALAAAMAARPTAAPPKPQAAEALV
jgi:hypothetical protein